MNFPRFRLLLLAVAVCASYVAVDAQTPMATLTITNNGNASGAVGVQPGGNVCNPNPGGGGGGAPCTYSYPVGTQLRIMANSPSTPGIFNSGVGDTASCATSVCVFTLNGNSAITATFDPGGGPYPSLTIGLQGDGKGNVGTDNNQCQNFELGFSACTTYYGAGSSVRLQGRSMPGNIFAGFSGGTVDAGGCTGTGNCVFTLSNNSSVDASFSAMASVAITPPTLSTPVNTNAFFNATPTFTNNMTRPAFNGATPWQSHVAMDVARFSLAAATVNDRLYAIGGVDGACPSPGPSCPFGPLGTVEVFDPMVTLIAQFDQAWTPRQSMATPRSGLATAVVNDRIYAIGGHTSGGSPVASMESYDPSSNTWSARAPMSSARANMAAAVINGTIYAAGGDAAAGGDPAAPLTTVEAYDAVTNTWTTKAPMAIARRFPAAAAVNGTLYVIGGDGTGSVEAYDPATDTWTARESMPNGGGTHRAAALNGLIYAVGGSPVTTKVYNPAVNAWTTFSPSSQLPSGQFALAVLDGRLFATGGNLADNTAVKTLLANRPPETTWWAHNSVVARVNSGNNGSFNALTAGTSTISARLVNIDSGAQSALLTVTAGGGNFPIFLGIPSGAFAQTGQANWGCGTFGQTSSGPWTVQVDYGQGAGFENTPYIANPPPDGQCVQNNQFPKGLFFFNHAYNSPGDYPVTVKVTNITTTASQTGSFNVHVEQPEPEDCVPVVSNITAIGTVPFESVQVAVFNAITDELLFEGELPLGFFDDAGLPEGQYRIEFSVPAPYSAGYSVTPSTFEVDAVCGVTVNLNATVQAIPAVPPSISLTLSPNAIWPPNNKLVPVTATITASSPNGHATTVQLVSITNNESGAGDVAGATPGTDDRAFEVRAKRNGGGSGRIYTVTYRATDTVTGLSTLVSGTIVVPHDQGK
jgi:hypothetical protein